MTAADDYPHLALMWFQGDEGYDQAADALAEIDRLRAIREAAEAFRRAPWGQVPAVADACAPLFALLDGKP